MSSPTLNLHRVKHLHVESLEDRLLLTSLTQAPTLKRPAAALQIAAPEKLQASALPVMSLSNTATATPTLGLFDRTTLAETTARGALKRSRPSGIFNPKPAPSPDGVLKPPVLPGASTTVQLTIGAETTKAARPLGVNIGAMTAYAQGNAINNLITQGGGFELSDGRIITHVTGTSSTLTQVVIDGAWQWSGIGYTIPRGQMLIGSTGLNKTGAWRIADMRDQLDSSGKANGNIVITIQGAFGAVPVATDTFFVQLNNIGQAPLADNVRTNGNTSITRSTTTAHGGGSSALYAFGAGTADANAATLQYYFGADTGAGRNVFQQGHTYQITFWAKTATAGTANVGMWQGNNGGSADVALIADNQWHQYSYTLAATNPVVYENGSAAVRINAVNASVYVDDIRLMDLSDQLAPGSMLSKEVVDLVKNYGFANTRFWHPDLRFTNLDQLIGRPEDRKMVQEMFGSYDAQFGLPEMLELAKATGTIPWITLPTTFTKTDIHNLMEYLGGDASTVYGAKRTADGHAASWFADLKGIQFEAGNESWNGTFSPNSYVPFEPYFERAQDMFHDFKTDTLYIANAAKLELIVNGWQWVPWYTEQSIAHVPDADAVDISAYTSGPNTEMPINDLLANVLADQINQNSGEFTPTILGKKIYVYEEAPGELQGTITAATESAYATSLGAGLASIRNAMQLERDYGISTQQLFTMFQRGNNLPNGYTLGHYGLFTDLSTAVTNPRPFALAAKLMNNATGTILSSSLSTGWMIDSTSSSALPKSTPAADAMVTFDGSNLVITFFNNTVADAQNTLFHFQMPATIAGKAVSADWSRAAFAILNGPSVAANNETTQTVGIDAGQFTHSASEAYAALPGHSMGSLIIPLLF